MKDKEYYNYMIADIILTLTENKFKALYKNKLILTDATREDILNLFSQTVTLDATQTAVIYTSEDGMREESVIVKTNPFVWNKLF